MTPAQLAEAEAWLAQVDAASARIDAGTVAAVAAAYALVVDWMDPRQTVRAATEAAAAAAAGRTASAEVGAQLVAMITAVLGGPRAASSALGLGYPRQADPFDVYSRPIHVYRDSIARGLSSSEAQAAAFRRAAMLAETDNLLARRNGGIAQMEHQGARTYRRVIRPELSKTGTCGLCITAASRIYRTSDLMPIHTRCKCDVVPIVGGDDAGERFNIEDMRRLYAGMDATRKEDLIRFRYAVDENGELGPLLVPRKPATASEAPGAGVGTLGFEKQSAAWVRQQIAITESLKDSEWRTGHLARLRAQLANAA